MASHSTTEFGGLPTPASDSAPSRRAVGLRSVRAERRVRLAGDAWHRERNTCGRHYTDAASSPLTQPAPDPDAVEWLNGGIIPGSRRKIVTGIPGKTGIVWALDAARKGGLPRFDGVRDLLDDLHADD